LAVYTLQAEVDHDATTEWQELDKCGRKTAWWTKRGLCVSMHYAVTMESMSGRWVRGREAKRLL